MTTPHDKFYDGATISDTELLALLEDLSAMARAARCLGRGYASVEIAAATTWHAASLLAFARCLDVPGFA